MVTYETFKLASHDLDGKKAQIEYVIFPTKSRIFEDLTNRTGVWGGETFDELIQNYRNSKKKIRSCDIVQNRVNQRFGYHKKGLIIPENGLWHNDPFSEEEFQRLSQEVLAKLKGE